MLGAAGAAAKIVSKAGDLMDDSRLALVAGKTGKDTRITQRKIVALLESRQFIS